MRFMRLRAPSVSDSCHSAASETKDLFGLGCPSVRSFDGREPTKAPRRFEPLKQCLKCPSCDGQEDGKLTRTLITAGPKNGVRSLRVGLPCCHALCAASASFATSFCLVAPLERGGRKPELIRRIATPVVLRCGPAAVSVSHDQSLL